MEQEQKSSAPLSPDEIHRLATAPLPRIQNIPLYHGASRGPQKYWGATMEDVIKEITKT